VAFYIKSSKSRLLQVFVDPLDPEIQENNPKTIVLKFDKVDFSPIRSPDSSEIFKILMFFSWSLKISEQIELYHLFINIIGF
jgi:hypothetical protein